MSSYSNIDPYELMIISPNDKAKMIMIECLHTDPNLELIQALVTMGANVNWINEFSYTPLHFASINNKPEIARMLIDAGADLSVKDDSGLIALHFASWQNSLEIVKMLIESGSDVNALDNIDCTPLHWTTYLSNSEAAQMLIDAGADVTIENIDGHTFYEFWIINNSIEENNLI